MPKTQAMTVQQALDEAVSLASQVRDKKEELAEYEEQRKAAFAQVTLFNGKKSKVEKLLKTLESDLTKAKRLFKDLRAQESAKKKREYEMEQDAREQSDLAAFNEQTSTGKAPVLAKKKDKASSS